MDSLKHVLFEEYRGFADKRIKNFEKGSIFIVDDREQRDEGAGGNSLSYFCMVFAEVLSPTHLKVTLHGNVPKGVAVETWIKEHESSLLENENKTLEFEVVKGQQANLRALARAIRSIVAPGARRYSVPSYKYVCPRTVGSLDRLANTLDRAWQD